MLERISVSPIVTLESGKLELRVRVCSPSTHPFWEVRAEFQIDEPEGATLDQVRAQALDRAQGLLQEALGVLADRAAVR